MSQRWLALSRGERGAETFLPDLGLRLTVGSRTHRKFTLREFQKAGMTPTFYDAAFPEAGALPAAHVAFARCQDDPAAALRCFEAHPEFLAWHMLMTAGLVAWPIATHPPFQQRYPALAEQLAHRANAASSPARLSTPPT